MFERWSAAQRSAREASASRAAAAAAPPPPPAATAAAAAAGAEPTLGVAAAGSGAWSDVVADSDGDRASKRSKAADGSAVPTKKDGAVPPKKDAADKDKGEGAVGWLPRALLTTPSPCVCVRACAWRQRWGALGEGCVV